MVATLAFLFSATLAPANLYVFSDISLKYSPVLMISFPNLLKVVWTGNPLLDLLKVVWTGKPLLHFLKVAWTGMVPGSHSDLASYLGFHLIFRSMMALAPLSPLQNQYLLVALTGQHVIVIVVFDNLKKELEENPPPSPVMDSSGKKYKPYKDVFKTELSKAPPVLPKAPKSPGKPDKKLHPGFQMSLDKVRGFAKCNECGKPRVVYSKLKLDGNDVLYFEQKLGHIQSENEFNCGTAISSFFKKMQSIVTKIVIVDRRLSCNSGIEYQYYQSIYKMGSTEQQLHGSLHLLWNYAFCFRCE